MTCSAFRSGEEMVCSRCDTRWKISGDWPICYRDNKNPQVLKGPVDDETPRTYAAPYDAPWFAST